MPSDTTSNIISIEEWLAKRQAQAPPPPKIWYLAKDGWEQTDLSSAVEDKIKECPE